jgi:Xaa-Pro aminopeptidase
MIISNEPGYYKPGHYGIRIENLVTVIKSDRDDMDFCFETLTLAPISKSLINIELMNKNEINWINNYHKKVYKKLSSYLNKKEKKWLKEATEAI